MMDFNMTVRKSYGNAIVDYILNERPECNSKYLFVRELAPFTRLNGEGSSSADGSNYKTSPDYFLADEYNPETDAGLAYVAPKGHTYVAIEYRVKNLDRASVEFEGSFNPEFIELPSPSSSVDLF